MQGKDLVWYGDDAARVGALYCESFGIVADDAFFLGKLSEELGEVAAAVLKLTGAVARD